MCKPTTADIMVLPEELEEELGVLGFKMSHADAVGALLMTVCAMHNFDAESLAEEWFAYFSSMSSKVREREKVVTEDEVHRFEKFLLSRKSVATPAPPPTVPEAVSSPATPINASKSRSEVHSSGKSFGPPRLKQKNIPVNVDVPMDSRGLVAGKRPEKSFFDRENRGQILAMVGCLPKQMTWNKLSQSPTPVKVICEDPSTHLVEPYPLMFVKYQEVAMVLNSSMEDLTDAITIKHNIPGYSAPNIIGDSHHSFGRILPDADGGINVGNLWFQASSTLFNGIVTQLDLSLLDNFSTFPGQVVALKGHFNGKAFAASEMLTGALPEEVTARLPPEDTLHVLVACGPYNISEQIQPDPLKDFMLYVKDNKPDLVILMGPFVDERFVENETFLNDSNFIDHFKSVIKFVLDEIVEKLQVHIIILPSAGQVVGIPTYPVPCFELADCVPDAKRYKSVRHLITFAPEPSLLNINGVLVGLTSTDIIAHLWSKEVSKGGPVNEDRAARLVSHLLLQRSFYPLYPSEVASDTVAVKKFAHIGRLPHILITPSEAPAFSKVIHDSVCINPGKLAKGWEGGSFCRIYIRKAEEGENDIVQRTAVQVIRV